MWAKIGHALLIISMLVANASSSTANETSKSSTSNGASNPRPTAAIEARGPQMFPSSSSPHDHDPTSYRLEFSHHAMSNGPLNATKMRLLVQHSELRRLQIAAAVMLPPAASSGPTYRTSIIAGAGAFLTSSPTTGTPGVSFRALIDTGSDLIWRQCRPCQDCFDGGSSSHIFDPSRSSTSRPVSCYAAPCTSLPRSTCSSRSTCSYVYTYGDSSYTAGDLVSDTITMPDTEGRPVPVAGLVFGCGHDNENSDFAGADGLIGLGQGPLSLLSQLRIPRFSYCLQTITDPEYRTSPLFLGGGAALAAGAVQSTALVASRTFYSVGLAGVRVGGLEARAPGLSEGIIIFDSGTTITYLLQPIYEAVLQLFRASIPASPIPYTGTGLDLCYEDMPAPLPSLSFRFAGGAEMELPAGNYFLSVEDAFYCLAMAGSTDISIFGNVQQQNFHILYDIQAQRLSFAPAVCDTL